MFQVGDEVKVVVSRVVAPYACFEEFKAFIEGFQAYDYLLERWAAIGISLDDVFGAESLREKIYQGDKGIIKKIDGDSCDVVFEGKVLKVKVQMSALEKVE